MKLIYRYRVNLTFVNFNLASMYVYIALQMVIFPHQGITMVAYVLLERYTTVCASRQSKFGDENITSSVASEKI